MSANVETLLENVCSTTGEGPHWDDKTGQLMFVDIQNNTLHRWNSSSGSHETKRFGELFMHRSSYTS